MKPHPRIRKTIKWSGAAVTVLLVVVWIASGWWTLQWMSRDGHLLGLSAGRFLAASLPSRFPGPGGTGWGVAQLEYDFEWAFYFRSNVSGWTLSVPLWIPSGVMAVAALTAWRLDTLARRRAHLNLCSTCAYDRTGLAADAKCPECGTLPKP